MWTGEPGWTQHAVWWHVYPLGFLGAERVNPGGPPVHRLGRLIDWLDYAVELGTSGLALGPIFESQTHGYDTVDPFRIDRRLGTEDDFAELVEAARARGLRILLDGVFNHVGRDFPAFRQVLEDGPQAPGAQWFRLRWPGGAGPGTEPEYDTFEGHRDLVALNHGAPLVAEHVVNVMCHWLERGAAGWRLDAAYAVPARFWAAVLPKVRERYPSAYFVGEVLHGDYAAIAAAGRMDALTQYEVWKAIWSSLHDWNFFELAWALRRHNAYLESLVPLTFVGNHDVTRIASQLADPRHLVHALLVLCTIGGTPSIYYGDERGWQAVKEHRAGGDDAIRPAYPEGGPVALEPDGWSMYRQHQVLLGLRRRHPWLHRAQTVVRHLTNRHIGYESVAGTERLGVALSVDDVPVRCALPGAGEILAGTGVVHRPHAPDAQVELPPHGWAVCRMRSWP